MPPKQKFSKEVVLKTAFQLVREQGFENLNARNIAKMLKSSTQPVFSYYKNMADLKADVFAMVNECHKRHFDRVELGENLLVNIGMAYIDFAIEEPNLFRTLFMSGGFSGLKLSEFFSSFEDDCHEGLSSTLAGLFDLSRPESMQMFLDIWLYAHGIASMLVANQLPTPRNELEAMLKNMYGMLVNNLLGDKK